ncbi:MAG: YggT family protein [Verrucomicrobia bacterium]|nr:YggT family protein [Verrucomicrobiota bacterium]
MLFFANVIHWAFLIYTLFLLVRIIGSWFPSFAGHQIMRFVAFYTDPYLNLFRRVIPPIGGVLDLSPLLAFFALQIAENLILYILI